MSPRLVISRAKRDALRDMLRSGARMDDLRIVSGAGVRTLVLLGRTARPVVRQ